MSNHGTVLAIGPTSTNPVTFQPDQPQTALIKRKRTSEPGPRKQRALMPVESVTQIAGTTSTTQDDAARPADMPLFSFKEADEILVTRTKFNRSQRRGKINKARAEQARKNAERLSLANKFKEKELRNSRLKLDAQAKTIEDMEQNQSTEYKSLASFIDRIAEFFPSIQGKDHRAIDQAREVSQGMADMIARNELNQRHLEEAESQRQALAEEVAGRDAFIGNLQSALNEVKAEARAIAVSRETMQTELLQGQADLMHARDEIKASAKLTHQEAVKQTAELLATQEQLAVHQTQLKDLFAKNAALADQQQATVDALAVSIEEKEKVRNELRVTTEIAARQLDEKQQEIERFTKTLAEHESLDAQTRENFQTALDEATAVKRVLTSQLEEAQEKLQGAEVARDAESTRLAAVAAVHEQSKEELATTQKELSDLQAQVDFQARQVADLTAEVDVKTAQSSSVAAEKTAVEEELAALRQQLNTMEEKRAQEAEETRENAATPSFSLQSLLGRAGSDTVAAVLTSLVFLATVYTQTVKKT